MDPVGAGEKGSHGAVTPAEMAPACRDSGPPCQLELIPATATVRLLTAAILVDTHYEQAC